MLTSCLRSLLVEFLMSVFAFFLLLGTFVVFFMGVGFIVAGFFVTTFFFIMSRMFVLMVTSTLGNNGIFFCNEKIYWFKKFLLPFLFSFP